MTATTTAPADTTFASTPGAASWRSVCTIALLVTVAGDIVAQVVVGNVIPPVAGFALLSLVAAAVLRRPGRAGPILALAVSVLALVGGAPFVLEALAHPDSPVDFLHGVTSTVFRLVAAVSAVGVLRRWAPESAGKARLIAAAVGAAAVVLALASFLAAGSEAAMTGDAAITAENLTWSAGTLEVEAGGTVFVDNADGLRHTFTVEGTDVSAELPAWQDRRVAIDLEPGQYRLICAVPGHETMTASLNVR